MQKKQSVCQADEDAYQFEISATGDTNSDEIKEKTHKTVCEIVIFIFGILFVIVSVVDAIIFFYFPFQKIKDIKQNFNNAKLSKLPIFFIINHFILHTFVFLFGFLIALSFCKKDIYISKCVPFLLVFIIWSWLIQATTCPTKDYKVDLYIDDIFHLINNNPPLDFIKVNTHKTSYFTISTNNGQVNMAQTYSRKEVLVPITTNITSKIYNYNDFPDIFYITISQEIKISDQLSSYLKNAFNVDYDTKSFDSKTFLVSKQKHISYLTKKVRIISHIFGVGIYYKLYSKSIPNMINKVYLNAEMVPNFNYSNII